MNEMRITVAEGKYTFIASDQEHGVKVLLHGKLWLVIWEEAGAIKALMHCVKELEELLSKCKAQYCGARTEIQGRETKTIKFRKKPLVVEAVRFVFNPENCKELADFLPDGIAPEGQESGRMFIKLPGFKGPLIVKEGDWIIKGVDGEFYPCPAHVFEKTYEPVRFEGEENG